MAQQTQTTEQRFRDFVGTKLMQAWQDAAFEQVPDHLRAVHQAGRNNPLATELVGLSQTFALEKNFELAAEAARCVQLLPGHMDVALQKRAGREYSGTLALFDRTLELEQAQVIRNWKPTDQVKVSATRADGTFDVVGLTVAKPALAA